MGEIETVGVRGEEMRVIALFRFLSGLILCFKFQVLNGSKYNHKADVYSFAICLWETYVCDMPFPNLTIREMAAIVNQVHSCSNLISPIF